MKEIFWVIYKCDEKNVCKIVCENSFYKKRRECFHVSPKSVEIISMFHTETWKKI